MIFRDYAKKLERLKKAVPLLLKKEAADMQTQAKKEAKKYWIDRSSHARQSLHAGVDKLTEQTYLVWIAHGRKYGIYLEKGTKHIKARPLLQDTAKEYAPKIQEDIRKLLK